MKNLALVLIFLGFFISANSQNTQKVLQEDIFLTTFGNMSEKSCVDDDFSQLLFFAIPVNFTDQFYLRIFDPDCGGKYDLSIGLWETNTQYELYGGLGCISNIDARNTDPVGAYKSGKLLAKGIFAEESVLDGQWVSYGPFTANQGEQINAFPDYSFFKVIVEGRTGNDGNMYELLLSKLENKNEKIDHAVFFHYELTYQDKSSKKLDRLEAVVKNNVQLTLPIKLEKISTKYEYNIMAVPLDE